MNNPALKAFFLGRAFAEVLGEKVEVGVTHALSELGKFDAEQRENLRQFVEEVQTRAAAQAPAGNGSSPDRPEDLQETIDELRAEIVRLKSELKAFRND